MGSTIVGRYGVVVGQLSNVETRRCNERKVMRGEPTKESSWRCNERKAMRGEPTKKSSRRCNERKVMQGESAKKLANAGFVSCPLTQIENHGMI